MSAGAAFVRRSRALLAEYVAKIETAIAGLTADQIWWRPNEESNSVGNLLLHLAGNVRQWIVAGVGGEADVRRRQEEFDARSGSEPSELLVTLKAAVGDADRVLAALDPGTLEEKRSIQGRQPSVLDATYHVVEHFSGHTFQILYITKLLTGRDLGFYSATGLDRWNSHRDPDPHPDPDSHPDPDPDSHPDPDPDSHPDPDPDSHPDPDPDSHSDPDPGLLG